jgi:hypothetical protein
MTQQDADWFANFEAGSVLQRQHVVEAADAAASALTAAGYVVASDDRRKALVAAICRFATLSQQ